MNRSIPDNIASKIANPEDRKALGIRTDDERKKRYEAKLEKELRNQIIGYCRRRDWLVGTAQTHKKSGYTIGWPDACVVLPEGITLFAELKTLSGLSKEQEEMIARMRELGHHVEVITSFEQFISVVRSLLKGGYGA